jgi:site-specific recombinase XerC
MTEHVGAVAEQFVEYRRALGRKYISEQRELRLLVRFADRHGIHQVDQLTAVSLESFLASRPRRRPRSFNHLLGVIRGFLDWAVVQELLAVSPLQVRRRRVTAGRLPFIFDTVQARRLLAVATALPDNPRALQRGPTYRVIFALCYGLGLRVTSGNRPNLRHIRSTSGGLRPEEAARHAVDSQARAHPPL